MSSLVSPFLTPITGYSLLHDNQDPMLDTIILILECDNPAACWIKAMITSKNSKPRVTSPTGPLFD